MKKFFLSLSCIIIILLTGCNSNPSRYLNLKENKDKNYYYTEISKKIENKEEFTVEVFDSNFYKTYSVPNEYKNIITGFFSSITSDNFVEKIDKSTNKKVFEIILKFDSDTYYLTIINNEYLYISPFDGYVESDFINMSNMDAKYNLYNFCTFISEKREPM